jgi:hypothetical protein
MATNTARGEEAGQLQGEEEVGRRGVGTFWDEE